MSTVEQQRGHVVPTSLYLAKIMALNAALREQREQIASLEERVSKDRLTGLYNRMSFDEQITREISNAKRTDKPLTLMFVDIDYFKRVNDTYGHSAGDAVLRNTAGTLTTGVRITDYVARYGGEEMVVLLPNTDKLHAVGVVGLRLLDTVRQATNLLPDGRRLKVTVSIGVDTFTPTTDTPRSIEPFAQTLISEADRAMYCAKHAGRNRIGIIIENEAEKLALNTLLCAREQDFTLIRR